MKKVALALLALLPLNVSAHLELDLLTPDGDLYPGCEVEPESRPSDCPYRLQIQGWDVYVSSLIMADELEFVAHGYSIDSPLDKILTTLNYLDVGLGMLEMEPFPRDFANKLRGLGVNFYIAPVVISESGPRWHRHPDDNYAICNVSCYSRALFGNSTIQLPLTVDGSGFGAIFELLVHELAHAWHDLFVPDSYDNQCIIDAYEFSVVRDKLYRDFVIRSPDRYPDEGDFWGPAIEQERFGDHNQAYAARNYSEYFAEAVVAYFLQDTFTPPTRGGNIRVFSTRMELYDGDRNGYWIVEKLVDDDGIGIIQPENCDRQEGFWPK